MTHPSKPKKHRLLWFLMNYPVRIIFLLAYVALWIYGSYHSEIASRSSSGLGAGMALLFIYFPLIGLGCLYLLVFCIRMWRSDEHIKIELASAAFVILSAFLSRLIFG